MTGFRFARTVFCCFWKNEGSKIDFLDNIDVKNSLHHNFFFPIKVFDQIFSKNETWGDEVP